MAAVSAEEARAAARAKLDVFRVIRAPPTALYIRDFITQDEAQALVQQVRDHHDRSTESTERGGGRGGLKMSGW